MRREPSRSRSSCSHSPRLPLHQFARRVVNGNRRANHNAVLPQFIAETAPGDSQDQRGLRLIAVCVTKHVCQKNGFHVPHAMSRLVPSRLLSTVQNLPANHSSRNAKHSCRRAICRLETRWMLAAFRGGLAAVGSLHILIVEPWRCRRRVSIIRRTPQPVGCFVKRLARLVEYLASRFFGLLDRFLGLLFQLLLVDRDTGFILAVVEAKNTRYGQCGGTTRRRLQSQTLPNES